MRRPVDLPVRCRPLADRLHYEALPVGRWAVFRHVGPCTTRWLAWTSVCRDWVPRSGHTLPDAMPSEHYVNDPREVSPDQLITDLYIPIE